MIIDAGYVRDMAESHLWKALTENGTVDFDYESIKFWFVIKNTGEESGDATVTLKDGNGNQLEQKTVTVDGGATGDVIFDNAGSGYSLPDGQTNSYTTEVTP